ncbi:MAG: spermidine synthase, partial [Chloroflexi bacterium]|nr:spermidine synthase [Chloroflexota bacterium]
DQEVVELCRRFLPQHHQGSFDDPRVELIFQDARQYLEESRESFDVLIMDLVDPLEGGTAYRLYTEEFYRIVKSRMGAGGIMVTQSGPAGLLSFDECFTTIYKTLASIFASTVPSQVHVPAFATLWGIILASESKLPTLTDEQVDGLVAERINKELRFYDGESHRNMFAMPRYVRQGIQQESRINRDATPVFMI